MPTIQTDQNNIIYVIPTADELASSAAALKAKQSTPAYYAKMFNPDLFVQALFNAFAADSNLFSYYAVLKDLAVYKNFAWMNTIVNQLLAANILTQAEVTTLNGILAQQNIVLSTFTS